VGNYSIDIFHLEKVIEEDIANGLIPFWFSASIGATATGNTDDIASIGSICRKYGIFLNVDAAYKGT
jgi:aromatic-L-amino-acid decarboxylase